MTGTFCEEQAASAIRPSEQLLHIPALPLPTLSNQFCTANPQMHFHPLTFPLLLSHPLPQEAEEHLEPGGPSKTHSGVKIRGVLKSKFKLMHRIFNPAIHTQEQRHGEEFPDGPSRLEKLCQREQEHVWELSCTALTAAGHPCSLPYGQPSTCAGSCYFQK